MSSKKTKSVLSNQRLEVIPVLKIIPSRYQIRSSFDEEKLKELARSIQERGLKNPIHVCVPNSKGQYELIDGERRTRSFKIAGLHEILAIVDDVPQDELAMSVLVANWREDYQDHEKEAMIYRAYQESKSRRYQNDKSMTDVAKALGVNVSTVARYVEAYEFRQKLPLRIRKGTSFTAISETSIIQDDNIRIMVLEMIHDRKQGLRIERNIIREAAKLLASAPPVIQNKILNEELTLVEAQDAIDQIRLAQKKRQEEGAGPIPQPKIEKFAEQAVWDQKVRYDIRDANKRRNVEYLSEIPKENRRDSILPVEAATREPSEGSKQVTEHHDAIRAIMNLAQSYDELLHALDIGILGGRGTPQDIQNRQKMWMTRLPHEEDEKRLEGVIKRHRLLETETKMVIEIFQNDLKQRHALGFGT